MKFRDRNGKKSGFAAAVDLTPIVDTVFNLLIFFALSLNFAATSGGINVRLPKAATAEPVKAEQLTISLTKDGKVYLNDKVITIEELSKTLEGNQDKESLVIVRADNDVSHGRVVEIMDTVKTQGFSRLAIGVDQPPPPETR